jgi:hypothetical protein
MLLGQHAIRKAPLDAPPPHCAVAPSGAPSGRLAAASIQFLAIGGAEWSEVLRLHGDTGHRPVKSQAGGRSNPGD